MERVADWQIANWDKRINWNKGGIVTKQHDALNWTNAALYMGMLEFSEISDNDKYLDWVRAIGEKHSWQRYIYPPRDRPYHADDYAVGQAYLKLYQRFGDPEMLKPMQQHLDWIIKHQKTGSIDWIKGTDRLKRWGWSDALFMAPPVWVRLANISGDEKYLDFMHQEYKFTYDFLFDQSEGFFYRDASYFDSREKNGQKVFWSRGNGWVFSGLALMLPQLPSEWQHRDFYLSLYKQMAESLIKTQKADGSWPMGLLGGQSGYPNKEVSGTGFFVHGLAWGINNGILDKNEYQDVVFKGWQALESSIQADGMLGFVQPVGAAPGESGPEKSEVFGVGAFLAAGSEVYKLLEKDKQ